MLQTWTNGKVTKRLKAEAWAEYYLEYRNGTFWICGHTLFSLLNTGWKRLK